jgi:TorA maturation chaperone TorD
MTANHADINLAREGSYRVLAALLDDPRRPVPGPTTLAPEVVAWLNEAAEVLRTAAADADPTLGFGEQRPERLRFSVLGTLANDLDAQERRREFERVFGLMSCRECPPFETEFCPNGEPFYRAQQLADLAGFYRAFGLSVPAQQSLRPDHLPLELAFMAFLLMKERLAPDTDAAAVCADAARQFFTEHLAWWVPSFCRGLQIKAGEGLYAELARVLAAFVTIERRLLGLPAPAAPLPPAAAEEATANDEACATCSARVG